MSLLHHVNFGYRVMGKSRSALCQHTSLLLQKPAVTTNSCWVEVPFVSTHHSYYGTQIKRRAGRRSKCPLAAHITPTDELRYPRERRIVEVPFGSTYHSYLFSLMKKLNLVFVAVPFGSTHHSYQERRIQIQRCSCVEVPFGSTYHPYP